MAFRSLGRVCSTHIQAQLPTSSVVHMSSLVRATRYVQSVCSCAQQTEVHQSDVTPSLIMSRVEAASGAKYSVHKETARKFEPIAPVGTSYTPIGKVDIGAIRNAATATKPITPSTPRSVPLAPSPAPGLGRAPIANRAPVDAWPEDSQPASPPAPPSANRPPVVTRAAQAVPLVGCAITFTLASVV